MKLPLIFREIFFADKKSDQQSTEYPANKDGKKFHRANFAVLHEPVAGHDGQNK
jgi:hypothetical protein